jgi:uncharacterized protein (DUF952 family)
MSLSEKFIYHLTSENDFRKYFINNLYTPSNFQSDGFIHCSGIESVIDVATDYYSKVTDLILIKINTNKLKSTLKYEDPVPLNESENNHIKNNLKFPHIYGPMNKESILGIGKMGKKDGQFEFPLEFIKLSDFLTILKR